MSEFYQPTRGSKLRSTLLRLWTIACLLSCSLNAVAANAERLYVPPELAPWVDWVLADHPELQCPRDAATGDPDRCAWISSLGISVSTGAEFTMTAQVYAPSRIDLPGNQQHWPTNIKVNGEPGTVIGGSKQPALVLQAGNYRITGEINWRQRPTTLQLPAHAGLVALTLDGTPVVRPARNGNALLLGKRANQNNKTQRNSLTVNAFRLITDNYPLQMDTTLVLEVGGQPRISKIGRVLLEGFEVVSFSSPIPARLDAEGNLEVQIEPGTHQLQINARAVGSPTELKPAAATDNWPTQEIWGFQPRRNLRLVDLAGATPIDLSQTDAPFNRQEVRGYVLDTDSTLALTVQQQGNPNPPPNRFNIERQLWLKFDGSGYVVRDELGATINHASRLSASYPLGRVSVSGRDELINSLDGSEPGIELQTGSYQITAVSELDRNQIAAATGWNVNSDSLRAQLNLPPGWRLLWATGVDRAPNAWLSRWSLWKIFVLVLLGVLVWRFLSRGFAVLLSVTTGLMMHAAPALAVIWLVAIVLVAAGRHIEHAGVAKVLRALSWVWLGMAALIAISEAVSHARQAVYPQLEHYAATQNNYAGNDDLFADRFSVEAEQTEALGAPASSRDESYSRVRSKVAPSSGLVKGASPVRQKYGEGLQVQTGPGEPNWRWNSAPLIWDGPVNAQQTLRLQLLPPALNRLLNGLVALLLISVSALLLLALIPREQLRRVPALLGRITPILVMAVLAFPAHDANAAAPETAITPALLKQLEARLLVKPECFPNCANLQRAEIAINRQQLELKLELHGAELVSVPLPASPIWHTTRILVDGEPATVASSKPGQLEIALTAGRHSVLMTGAVAHLERFNLNWPLSPAQVTSRLADDWQITGLVNGKVARGTLGFERKAVVNTQDKTLKPATAKPYVQVTRTLRFDQEWYMHTQVSRVAPTRGGFSLNIPLLFDEAVLESSLNISAGQARLVFGRNDRAFAWTSRIEPRTSLELQAPPVASRSAIWTLVPSNFWHIDYSGMNPVGNSAERAGPTFFPAEGDTLVVQLTQTTPVAGATVTIERVTHRVTTGARQQRHELTLNTLASQGGTLPITLSATATGETAALEVNELVSVVVNGSEEPISLIDNLLPLPLTPGQTHYQVTWLENTPRSMWFSVAAPTLEAPASNVSTSVQMSRDRWVLLLGGPALGPGILYWGMLLVVVLLAMIISRIPGLPFTATDAILLSLGLSLANLPATLLIAIWVIALRFRGALVSSLSADWSRNLLQVTTAGLSILTIGALIFSVPNALLGSPDMQVEGNGSSAYLFNWFTDQTGSALPSAWVLSLPLWVYRVIMLVWSLWLAFALIRWVPWAWRQWSTPALWYSTKAQPPTQTTGESTP